VGAAAPPKQRDRRQQANHAVGSLSTPPDRKPEGFIFPGIEAKQKLWPDSAAAFDDVKGAGES
jgi:hypothetical protein